MYTHLAHEMLCYDCLQEPTLWCLISLALAACTAWGLSDLWILSSLRPQQPLYVDHRGQWSVMNDSQSQVAPYPAGRILVSLLASGWHCQQNADNVRSPKSDPWLPYLLQRRNEVPSLSSNNRWGMTGGLCPWRYKSQVSLKLVPCDLQPWTVTVFILTHYLFSI